MYDNSEAETIDITPDVRVKIYYDTVPQNPRNEWDHLSIMCYEETGRYYRNRFNFPHDEDTKGYVSFPFEDVLDNLKPEEDESDVWRAFQRHMSRKNHAVRFFTLADYGSGGYRLHDDGETPDDSTNGFIFIPSDRLDETPDAQTYLKGELDEFRAYLEGDVYGYVVEVKTTEEVTRTYPNGDTEKETSEEWVTDDSCWGYYGIECCREDAKSIAETVAKRMQTAVNSETLTNA